MNALSAVNKQKFVHRLLARVESYRYEPYSETMGYHIFKFTALKKKKVSLEEWKQMTDYVEPSMEETNGPTERIVVDPATEQNETDNAGLSMESMMGMGSVATPRGEQMTPEHNSERKPESI